MFDFRNGMLGVVIVTLALGGAIFGAYFAGIESVEHEVVKYNELADVTGLFETDKSPQYIDYDPSTNYVGYYSDNSYSEEMGKYYFAEDEVGYTPSQKQDGTTIVNNYKIYMKPTNNGTSTIRISNISGLEQVDDRYLIFYHPYPSSTTNNGWTWGLGKPYSLKSLIDNLSFDETTTDIYITTSGTDWTQTTLNVPLILPNSMGEIDVFHQIGLCNPDLNPTENNNWGSAYPVYRVSQSYIINLSAKTVTAFADADWSKNAVTYKLDNMVVVFGEDPEEYGTRHLNLSENLTYQEWNIRYDYLDPNKGVYLKGDE